MSNNLLKNICDYFNKKDICFRKIFFYNFEDENFYIAKQKEIIANFQDIVVIKTWLRDLIILYLDKK